MYETQISDGFRRAGGGGRGGGSFIGDPRLDAMSNAVDRDLAPIPVEPDEEELKILNSIGIDFRHGVYGYWVREKTKTYGKLTFEEGVGYYPDLTIAERFVPFERKQADGGSDPVNWALEEILREPIGRAVHIITSVVAATGNGYTMWSKQIGLSKKYPDFRARHLSKDWDFVIGDPIRVDMSKSESYEVIGNTTGLLTDIVSIPTFISTQWKDFIYKFLWGELIEEGTEQSLNGSKK